MLPDAVNEDGRSYNETKLFKEHGTITDIVVLAYLDCWFQIMTPDQRMDERR